ncbi:MAG: di-trans,poly-cis-decaprenylcistransferase [Omnitrophica WOR_2 bacterium RBG_13_44_8b]|nr:MAG: di-trans,poly-cis-decaprenylcistransferase [Omnitrophica WOR_2 bacterium RBG_13_44_8b]
MIDKDNEPRHIAIIMDGNGRWAKERGLPRTAGHREGIKRVKEIIKSARQLGVQVVTFFAFSSENWSRPKAEVNLLMRFLNNFLDKEISELDKNNVRIIFIGQDEPIPALVQKKMRAAEAKTKHNSGITMALALNYGARQEILDAVKKFMHAVGKGDETVDGLNEANFSRYLYTAELPDPDLLIRTSGENRISNFLLWQLSYAELYFPKKYWPDFRNEDLENAIEIYQKRERRFGGIDAGKKNS